MNDVAMNSLIDGFVTLLSEELPELGIANQDGYEIIRHSLGSYLTEELVRGIKRTDVEKMAKFAKEYFEDDRINDGMIIKALKAGLAQYSGDGVMHIEKPS